SISSAKSSQKHLQRSQQLCDTLAVSFNRIIAGTLYLMPITSISGIAAVALYLLTLGLQSQSLKSGTGRQRTQTRVIFVGFIALLAHAISAWSLISRDNAYHFGMTEISTLIFASIVLVTLLSSV